MQIDDAALLQALHRLEDRGYIAGDWGVTENGRRAKFYALTPLGRRMLRTEESRWRKFVETMSRVLAATPAGESR